MMIDRTDQIPTVFVVPDLERVNNIRFRFIVDKFAGAQNLLNEMTLN